MHLTNNILTMEPIDVYLMYCAMKAHFSKNDYDSSLTKARVVYPETRSINARTEFSLLSFPENMKIMRILRTI